MSVEGELWDALRDAGMLTQATFEVPPIPDPVWIGATFNEDLDVESMAHRALYEIEYQTADVPGLTQGGTFVIGVKRFTVQYRPMSQGTGHFSKARIKFAGPV